MQRSTGAFLAHRWQYQVNGLGEDTLPVDYTVEQRERFQEEGRMVCARCGVQRPYRGGMIWWRSTGVWKDGREVWRWVDPGEPCPGEGSR